MLREKVVYAMSSPPRGDPPTEWEFKRGTTVEAAVVQFASHTAWKDPDYFDLVKVEGYGTYRVEVKPV